MGESRLFEVARRQSDTVIINGETFAVRAVGLTGRIDFESTKDWPQDKRFAFLALHGCPALEGCTVEEIEEQLDPIALLNIATKIMELSGMGSGPDEEAEKNL